jgi:DNA-directed RNA polymerase specialized sigma24 family protein
MIDSNDIALLEDGAEQETPISLCEPEFPMELAMPDQFPSPVSTERKRKAVVPPKRVTKEMSLFQYLSECTPPLTKKIIDIACSQTQVPPELRDDAAQEISIQWSQTAPDCREFKPGQVASYAHRMARHTALRLRRELGSSVRLPGSAFRKRKDGTSYVTPGALAAPLSWNDLESWFQTDGLADGIGGSSFQGVDMDELSEAVESLDESGESSAVVDEEAETRKERSSLLGVHVDKLTVRQARIITLMVEGETYEEIITALDIKKGVLMRELAIASSLIGPDGDSW